MLEGNQISHDSDTDVKENISSIKLPPFWISKPEIWFKQIEAQFSLSKINSDKTKYNLVITNLPFEIITNIYDIINDPPQNNMYKTIKETLIHRLTSSEEQRLDDLLSGSEMGDRKPSDFYRAMLTTAGGSQMVSTELLLKLWKRRLPKTILVSITASGKENINDILDLADKIWETYKPSINFNNISEFSSKTGHEPYNNSVDKQISNLTKIINEFSTNCQNILKTISNSQQKLESQINAFSSQNLNQSNSLLNSSHHCTCTSRSRSRSRDKSPSTKQLLCYYHEKFKKKALKCQGPWCLLYESFNSKENSKN